MNRSCNIRRRYFALGTAALTCAIAWYAAEKRAVAADTDDSWREPILRIETTTHVANIKGIGTDAGNKYLVTVSDDKTVRVWKLPSGQAAKVIRPFIGKGLEGKLTAVAVSPDGRTIVAALYGPPNAAFIELFDLQTGRQEKHLPGVRDFANHIAFSRDGRYLAAALITGDLLLYDTSGYQLIAEDRDCSGHSYGVAFDAKDKIITACYDGFIREYELTKQASLHLLAKVKPPSGKEPFTVAASPDGSEIGVGFEDSLKIDVLSSNDLSYLFSPDLSGVYGSSTNGLSWSENGKTLYAGGAWGLNNHAIIRAWSNGGRGTFQDIIASDNAISQILPLRNGGIVFGSAMPSFGIIDAKGNRTVYVGPAAADYRLDQKGFLLSPDGATVQFAYELGGKSPARFSFAERVLNAAPSGTDGLKPAAVDGLPVTDWASTLSPKLNGKRIPIEEYELSRSLAIEPDQSGFLLGADWHVYFFNADGSLRWSALAPGTAWCVNVSGNGKLAAAAFGDGSIRWYGISDGKELLAFFPAGDRKRWVVWTPSGYYDASPGGEDLVGWHVNNGRDKASDFFRVGQFRSTYYRPDVIAKVIDTSDEAQAILAANKVSGRETRGASVAQMLPPVVEILSPLDGADVTKSNISVRYMVHSPSGEALTDVKVLVDGKHVSGERGVAPVSTTPNRDVLEAKVSLAPVSTTPNGDVFEAKVSIPPRDTAVSVIAINRFSSSTPATTYLHWRGANSDASEIKHKLYVLAVGVNQYSDSRLQQLHYAAKDAQDFAAALRRQKGGLYRDVEVKLLTDDNATKEKVEDGLDWIRMETTSDDVAMILLSGHGMNDPRGTYFFLPHDANMDKDTPLRTGVSTWDIQIVISSLPGTVLLFVDTCHSGNVVGGLKGGVADINGLINQLSSPENGAVVFAASTGTQASIENAKWSNGAFTKAVVEGIDGQADYHNTGEITLHSLADYISYRVEQLTEKQQTPMTQESNMIRNIDIALKR